MKRTKIQEAIDHIAKVRKASKLYKDAYLIRVCTTALEALCEKRDREKDPHLTLEELRGMEGGPSVWVSPVKETGKIPAQWMLVCGYNPNKDIYLLTPRLNITQGYDGKSYGKTWLAYRRKPEEGEA